MKHFSVIVIFNPDNKILLCKRQNNPYKGLFDVVGGHREDGEDGLSCAYRELYEETGIKKDDVCLHHVMGMNYCLSNVSVQIYFGKLNKEVALVEEKNPLFWSDLNQDFWDSSKFSGEGYLSHVLAEIKKYPYLMG